jgi:hypothetical protein
MSEQERTDTDARRSEQQREADRGRANRPQSDPNPGHTPSKAEGEVGDVEEALRRQE